MNGRDIEQADVVHAYAQVKLEGKETWICIPPASWKARPDLFYHNVTGEPLYKRPCVRLIPALYGHPDAGSRWERHCDTELAKKGFEPVPNWPTCYYRAKLTLLRMVYVDDFKLSGPAKNLKEGWTFINEVIETEGLAASN